MPRGQIVALATVVIPPENTPEKLKSQSLVAKPVWKYVGPEQTIKLEWQIGLWNSTFNGITARKYLDATQPANSDPNKQFTCDLPAIPLSSLEVGSIYDCEICFKDSFPDLRVIVENCVKIVEALQVIVGLKNAPSGATNWILFLYPWTAYLNPWVGDSVCSGELGLTDKAVLDIPPEWPWPLRFYVLVYRYVSGGMDLLHVAQSVSPDYQEYVEEFIPSSWVYLYNCTTRKFEKQ